SQRSVEIPGDSLSPVALLTTTEAMEIVLADQSTLNPSGIIKDVLVKIKDLVFPVDFVILDIEEDADIPIILGRPFLAMSHALIDMEKKELTIRIGDQESVIKVYKDGRDWCFKIETREKSQDDSHAGGWRMKVQIEELEEDMSQLTMEEDKISSELSHELKLLDIKEGNKEQWVHRWGRNRKIATKSKFGVKREPLKKPSMESMKLRFKRITDKDTYPERWINIPREAKEVKHGRKTLFKGDSPKEWDICYAFYKEQQMHDEKSEAL
ncbi:hypothetical protein A2U01_0025059, partial [Trifolium medium]|nr:hypothetical protein [Trifolium medium]